MRMTMWIQDSSPGSRRHRARGASVVLLTSMLAGCGIDRGVTRPPRGPAADLMDVSGIAPATDPDMRSIMKSLEPTTAVAPAIPAPIRAVAAVPTRTTAGIEGDVSLLRASTAPASPPLPAASTPATSAVEPNRPAVRVARAVPMPPEISVLPRAEADAPAPIPALPPGTAPISTLVSERRPMIPAPAPVPAPIPVLGPLPSPGPAMAGSVAAFPEISPPPVTLAGATPLTIPIGAEPYPIDLTSSLRLADRENPRIAEARVAILDALAQQQIARTLLFPSLNAGLNYHAHDGNLQRSAGRILRLSEQSLYVGGGARTLAAETINIPAVNFFSPLTEAIYEPLVARQRVAGAELNAAATANTVLLEVANLFFELIGAQAGLESRRLSSSEADIVVKVVADYAATGQGRKADADRAEAERRLFQGEIQHSEEEIAVASARLSRRLNLDAAIRLEALSGPLQPLTLIEPMTPVEQLIKTALALRPDLGARSALIQLSEYKLKEEQRRPLLPIVSLGFSGGAFGGGSNITPPLLAHFAGRTDFDVRATWTLLNFGVGNASLAKRRKAEVGEAMAERSRIINVIRNEVTSARAEALALRQRVEITRAELASAEAGYREDFDRLRETIGLPIEMIDSLKLLYRARLNLIETITRANQAQFALFVALGSPPPLDPSAGPLASPPPIATPLLSPIAKPAADPMPHVPKPGPPLLAK